MQSSDESSPHDTGTDPDRGLVIREIDGEVVALDPAAGWVHQLNPTASLIWRLATEGHDAAAIVGAIVRAHDVPQAVAREDVDRILVQLRSIKLLSAPTD